MQDLDTINRLLEKGETARAARLCRQYCKQHPGDVEAWSLLGMILGQTGEAEPARQCFRKVLDLAPDNGLAHYNYANACKGAGDLQEALEHYRHALRLNPAFAPAHFNLGNVLVQLDEIDQAIHHYRHAVRLEPGYVRAYNNLGSALQRQIRIKEAIDSYRQAIALAPSVAESHYNLATALQDHGDFSAAVASYRQALSLNPGHQLARSNLLYLLSYNVMCDPEQMLREHREWDRIHGGKARAQTFQPFHHAFSSPRIRVGYVSADFRQHVVSHFFEPLLRQHDRDQVEVFCYAEVRKPDTMTRRLRDEAEHWRFISGRDDRTVAQMIHDDGIDILVDLGGHTVNNRLKVFTYKPAPVQATYLGYFTTTGLSTMDYWITDACLHPRDTVELATEQLYRLPRCFLCYQPPDDAPQVAPAPHEDDAVTFGCFNNLVKISSRAIALWSRVLHAMPRSTLLLKSKQMADKTLQQELLQRFARHGIPAERIETMPHTRTFREHLDTYRKVDIALDTVPRSGFTITAEALWMGVPVVTLAGARFIERVSMDMLHSIGLQELVAHTEEEYVGIAAGLAGDLERRMALRRNLRGRMAASELCDGKSLAAALEQAYRDMKDTFLANSRN